MSRALLIATILGPLLPSGPYSHKSPEAKPNQRHYLPYGSNFRTPLILILSERPFLVKANSTFKPKNTVLDFWPSSRRAVTITFQFLIDTT